MRWRRAATPAPRLHRLGDDDGEAWLPDSGWGHPLLAIAFEAVKGFKSDDSEELRVALPPLPPKGGKGRPSHHRRDGDDEGWGGHSRLSPLPLPGKGRRERRGRLFGYPKPFKALGSQRKGVAYPAYARVWLGQVRIGPA